MRPLVNFQVLGSREDFAAAGERAGERFLAGMHPYVIDELVLGLEGPAVTRAPLPEARVRGALGTAHVLHREVRHDIVEGVEEFAAELPSGTGRVLIDPHARHLLPLPAADSTGPAAPASPSAVAPHVPEKRAVGMMARMGDGRVLLMMDRSRGQMGRAQVLVVRGQPRVLGIVARIVAGRQSRMLARVMGELLHRGGRPVVVERREQSQPALGRGWVRGRVELVLTAQKEVAGRVAGMMAHVVAHVGRHVGRRMGVVRRISLGVKVMMLLGRGVARWRLDTCAGVR